MAENTHSNSGSEAELQLFEAVLEALKSMERSQSEKDDHTKMDLIERGLSDSPASDV